MLQKVGIFLLAEALAEAAKFYWLKLLSFIFRGQIWHKLTVALESMSEKYRRTVALYF